MTNLGAMHLKELLIYPNELRRVEIDSGAHPASYPMDTGTSFLGVKAAGS
jgi:hypothetical protein